MHGHAVLSRERPHKDLLLLGFAAEPVIEVHRGEIPPQL